MNFGDERLGTLVDSKQQHLQQIQASSIGKKAKSRMLVFTNSKIKATEENEEKNKQLDSVIRQADKTVDDETHKQFKYLLSLLREESVLQSIRRRIDEISKKTPESNTVLPTDSKINKIIWSKILKCFPSKFQMTSTSACQELFHQNVCKKYMQKLQQYKSFANAYQSFPLFSLIHSKILLVFDRLKQFDINEESLCRKCHINSKIILDARKEFKNKNITK